MTQTLLATPAWAYLPMAVLLGILHALEPGHAKSLMAGYIVAIHGRVRDAVTLGVSAAISHTLIVWVLAALGLYLSNHAILETARPYLSTIAGVAALIIAGWMLWSTHKGGGHGHSHNHGHSHDHEHGHEHGSSCGHDHSPPPAGGPRPSLGQIAFVGLTGGLMPCPAAVAVLILCLNIKQVSLGFTMVLAFSLGLALTLVGVGVLAAVGLSKLAGEGRMSGFMKRLPTISALVIGASGVYTLIHGLL
ncbi:sulfite exporter TauE/SafE family protein [Lacibacterium aquatile]|uniref:Nickel/cobalt efflux system n=1 Tax=Lacibacterium aquatile TaxID=1168082 RepID=A0ABW5DMD3_9PROT